MNDLESDFVRRWENVSKSDRLEINALQKYFAAKDGPAPEELADSRQGIIDAAYDAINIAKEKLENAFPDETIPKPVWITHVNDGKEVVGGIDKEVPAAYLMMKHGGDENIIMHPDLMTMYSPREIAAIYAHEGGHDLSNISGKTARQEECIADHTAQALGYGSELASALQKLGAKIDLSQDKDHPAISDRVAALADKTRENLPIGSVTFDDKCNITSVETLSPLSTPGKSTVGWATDPAR